MDTTQCTENWKLVTEYEGFYEVSDLGRVRSVDRWVDNNGCQEFRKGRILRPGKQASGHLFVNLSRYGKTRTRRIHRLVMAAFIGPCPDGLCVNHIDGNPVNNLLANLEYITPRENSRHAVGMGRFPLGEKHHNAKLNNLVVREMRRLRAEGLTFQRIADQFGTGRKTAERAIKGECWASVR